jgi:hypothetical protein
MSSQFLFYRKVVPVSAERHGTWSVDRSAGFHFARGVSSVPLTAVEIPHAGHEYTIVFRGEGIPTPVVLLGLEGQDDSRNAYVGDDGSWGARYIPAFIRRYPFLFALSEDGSTLTLCIDEDFEGCNEDSRGDALFDADGERTPYLNGVLEFLQDYQGQFARTEGYCKKLKELDLLEAMEAKFDLGGAGQGSLRGFQAVKREKLKELEAGQLLELAKSDELELTYAHLGSMTNFSGMLERLAQRH